MRERKSQRGSVTVWLIGIVPVLVVIMLFFVNTVIMIDTKLRLQAAIDRGVYAGAAYLSHAMNEVAKLNWQFRKEFLNTKEKFDTASSQTTDSIKKELQKLDYNHGLLAGRMNKILNAGYKNAQQIAEEVTQANLEGIPHIKNIHYRPEYGSGPMFEMVDDWEGGRFINKERVVPAEVVGIDFDPDRQEESDYIRRSYLTKSLRPEYFVAIAGSITTQFRPPFLTRFFSGTDGVRLGAIAAAQPYGGSAKEFSFVDAGGSNEAADLEAGREHLYHPAFIPVGLLVEEADVEH